MVRQEDAVLVLFRMREVAHLGGPAVAECLSLSGLDYVIIDTEHGPFPDESTGEMYLRGNGGASASDRATWIFIK